MPPKRTARIARIQQQLRQRLAAGLYQPGDRYLSNRAVARQFNISYQTAHRLLSELVEEGALQRRPQSGTYLPGPARRFIGAQLIFDRRAARAESFGAKLLAKLTERMDAAQIDWTRRWAQPGRAARPDQQRVAIVWESPATIARCAADEHPVILINDRPPLGMGALYIDSLSNDDFGGGASAAQLLRRRAGRSSGRYAILAGPRHDPRSRLRVEGFRSIQPAEVIFAEGWFVEDGLRAADRVLQKGSAGIFCCNDRLAQAVIQHCRKRNFTPPALVGFDNAPIAEPLNLTTIAIPWDELVAAVIRVLKRRLAGDRSASSQQIFHPRPIIRS